MVTFGYPSYGPSVFRLGGVVVRPRMARCSAPLALIQNPGGLRLEKIFASKILPCLGEVEKILTTPLEDQFVRPLPEQNRRIISRFSKSDVIQIDRITQLAETHLPTHYTSLWFKVLKSNGKEARLVQHLAVLGACLSPPRTPFTPLHDIVRHVLKSESAATADFANWFYQISIPPVWRRFFRANVSAGRGEFRSLELTVLSMGLSVSVFLAHSLALAIAALAVARARTDVGYDAWVDNLIWHGAAKDVEAVVAGLKSLAREFNFVWSDPPKIHEQFTFIGLRFDLRRKLTTPTSDSSALLRRNLLDLRSPLSLRSALSVVGLLLWLNWALARSPLAFFENLLSWIRAVGRDLLDRLDDTVQIPAEVRADIARLTEWTLNAELSLDQLESVIFDSSLSFFCDASDMALAAVIKQGDGLTVRVVPTDRSMTIFAREALALLLAVSSVPRHFTSAGAGIDNQNLLAALRRGHSKDPSVNAVLRALYLRLDASRLRLATGWIPSHLMLADQPSRGQPLPPDAASYFDLPVELRPLPFFRPPVKKKEGGDVS